MARRSDRLQRLFVRPDCRQARPMGGGERLFPARLRRLPKIPALGRESLYRQRRELRETRQNAGSDQHLSRTVAQPKAGQFHRGRRSPETPRGIGTGLMKTLRFTIHDSRFAIPIFLVLLLFLVRPIHSQNILLKTGQTIETKGVRVSGDVVMGKVQVGSSSGEVGYQISTIARIDFPEPPQLKTTEALLAQGQPAKALADIGPVVKYYEPLRGVPGNWWAPAALLKVSALAG